MPGDGGIEGDGCDVVVGMVLRIVAPNHMLGRVMLCVEGAARDFRRAFFR